MVEGKPGLPAILQLPAVWISAGHIQLSNMRTLLQFDGGRGGSDAESQNGHRAKVKLTLTPRSGRAPVEVEAECNIGSIEPGKVTLEDGVRGFYRDASGHHEIKGDAVTLSVFGNAISIVQDGDITLSTAPAP